MKPGAVHSTDPQCRYPTAICSGETGVTPSLPNFANPPSVAA